MQIGSGITCGRVLGGGGWGRGGEALWTEIIEVKLSAFVMKLFHENVSSIYGIPETEEKSSWNSL